MILLLAIAALAVGGEYPPDPDCDAGAIMPMVECLDAQSRVWEQRLNSEYQAALARGEVDVSKLRKAQRAWLAYREANCATYNSVEGRISLIAAGNCWRDMTRDRTIELSQMFWTG